MSVTMVNVRSEPDLRHKAPHSLNDSTEEHEGGYEFVKVKSWHEHVELVLVDVWSTVIRAKSATSVMSYLKQVLPKEPHSLQHLRRLVKLGKHIERSDEVYLSLLVCSVDSVPGLEDITHVLDGVRAHIGDDDDKSVLVPNIRQVARYPALTKEQSKLWSDKTWPIMWRGNSHAICRELPAQEQALYRKCVDKLLELTQIADSAGEVPVATLAVDPATYEITAAAVDTRKSSGNPLNHSTMSCIAKVAESEFLRRQIQSSTKSNREGTPPQAYLCHNLHLLTTHEPCAMCAMAMVHSRIARLVYVNTMPRTGCVDRHSGPGYGIHNSKLLNWRFESWRFDGAVAFPHVQDDINA
ncbi:cytidine deaminase-like protein [Lipomyces arxii]|uniref:cytidine deaminase-like protein n=1 Tax=Lipomyces arxii TaxID=56418 RepID=UPI0034CF4D21